MERMEKLIIMIDTPKSCSECCFQKGLTVYGYACGIAKTMNKDTHSRPDWCPLRPLPEKMKLAGKYDQEYFQKGGKMPSYKCGWNDCLDKITGGE